MRESEGFAEVAFSDSVCEHHWRFAMAERLLGQMSFADRLVADVARANATLERIEEAWTGARSSGCSGFCGAA